MAGSLQQVVERHGVEELAALLDVVAAAGVVLREEADRARDAQSLRQGLSALEADLVVGQRGPACCFHAVFLGRSSGPRTCVRRSARCLAASLVTLSSQVTK